MHGTRRHFVLLPLLAACLLCALQAQTPPPAKLTPYDLQIRRLQREFRMAPPPRQAVLLRRALELRDYIADREALQRWLRKAANEPGLHALVRDEAALASAEVLRREGDLDAAEEAYVRLGFVRQWTTVGPFLVSAPGTNELDAPFGPEQGFNSQKSYRDASGRERAWRAVPQPGPQAGFDLAHMHSHTGAAVAFLASAVHSDSPRRVALRLGADAAVALRVNGVEVLRRPEQARFTTDQHAIGVELRAGWNTIVVKLAHRGAGPWRFALRVTGPSGGGVVLRSSAEIGAAELAGQGVRKFAVPDLLAIAAESARGTPQSATALETLGLLRERRGFSGLAQLEQAARLSPAAERWRSVAEACTLPACRLNALTAALRVAPDDGAARIALAGYYREREQPLKARELLREAARLDAQDFVARMLLLEGAATSQASAALAQLQHEFPAPLWLQRRLAAAWERSGEIASALQAAEQARRHNFDGAEERALLERLYRRRRDTQALSALYGQAMRLAPTDTAPRARLAAMQAGAGELAAAEQTLDSALALDPDDAALQRQRAEVLTAAGRRREGRQQMAEALAQHPQLSSLRRVMQAVSPSPRWQEEDSAHVVDAARVAALAHHGSRPRGRAIALADVRVQRVFPGGLNVLRVQQVFHVGNVAGVREYSERGIQYSPATQELRILSARVHKPDGATIEAVVGGEGPVHDTSAGLYYDVRSRNLRFPGLLPGDVIELDYRVTPKAGVNPHGDYFGDLVMFGSGVPRRLQRYVLITPESREYTIVEERMPVAAQKEVRPGRRVYRWEARNLRSIPYETRGPALSELAPFVLVTSFRSWDELGQWYAALIRPQFEMDAALRSTLAQLIEGKRTDSEKIQAIHHFVLRNTQYLGLEFGIHSYMPYPVSQVLARRYGDCKDKTALMVALLRAAGIEAEVALVRTRRSGEVGERAPSIHIFNHAIVYIPAHELWLDGTAEYAGSRELPMDNAGALALTVALDGTSKLRRIPARRPEDNHTRRTVRAQVGDDGVIRFSGTVYTRGEDAPGLRRQYESPGRQREVLRSRLAAVVPSIWVEDVRVDGTADLERNVSVEFRGALHTFAGQRSISLAGSWMPRSFVDRLASLKSRTQDLLLPSPWTSDEELVFALPAGAVVTSVPRDTFLETPFGTASLKFEQRRGEVVVRSSVEFRAVRVAPADYAAFRRFCLDLERAFRGEVEVALPGGAAGSTLAVAGDQNQHSPEQPESPHDEATQEVQP